MIAHINGTLLAQSNQTIIIEGIHYFPESSLKMEYFEPSDLETSDPERGGIKYCNLVVAGQTYENAAWYYPNPFPTAEHLKSHVAFYTPPVQVQE